LTVASARKRDLALPVASWKRVVSGYRTQARKLVIRTKPAAKVTAAASGRVVYRSWSFRHGKSVWIKHGPRLFTLYQGLASVRVEPGQWVRAGKVLGAVMVKKTSKASGKKGGKHVVRTGELRFVVAVGGDPRSRSTRQFPLPFLDGQRVRLR